MTDQPAADPPTADPPPATDPPAADPRTAEPEATDTPAQAAPYRVLARKYRPASFADLIGQEALVRTLTNAIQGGRLAHAFILTGVRGVGKTTTARIIARALTCIGPDGAGGPTPEPCGVCEHCAAIAEDRHVDVIEMDAASRTGIDDIRELIEGVRYRPVQARRKIYIIDEVHMLSRQAFNGLLKTLEEPPEHVVFIFATTEIRKVPVTVLSRCQRFDLRRIDQDVLVRHFAGIAAAEAVAAEESALAMIARAADGSVRDGLSLLDQAIALGDGQVAADQVGAMLGLADRTRVLDLFDMVMRGAAPEALACLGDLYAGGADPAVVLQDLLELSHFLTRAKLVPGTLDEAGLPEAERRRGGEMAEKLSLPVLARCWQMLLKGLGEMRTAPAPLKAAEMVLIRLCYASDLPAPADLVRRLQEDAGPARPDSAASPNPDDGGARAKAPTAPDEGPDRTVMAAPGAQPAPAQPRGPRAGAEGGSRAALARKPDPAETPDPAPAAPAPASPASFPEVVALARERGAQRLANHLMGDVHLVRFEAGRIELRLGEHAPAMLAGQLGEFLQQATNTRWMVTVSSEAGAPSLRDQARADEAALRAAALGHPLVRAVLETFPEARLVARRDKASASPDLPTPDDTPSDGDERP